ncbi:DUF3320 domain-containing protein [Paracoccus sp. 11-3]|uniref:DUF3320 domain-containing protein n=1 Tax=Paracoccus amoyensis TaxID=2760093 RepID=A0A926JE17_9RHOB|nr:DUF3320 domain-containing protein [Paracoccus amoyensis]MBC9248364.1 DUF3320 domain-containing protein [Paracoccus amoyensis]
MDDLGSEATSYMGGGTLAEKLDRARMELLDLSARNRLLNMPRSAKAAKSVEAVDERSSEIFRLLVGEAKAFTFLPGLPSRKLSDEQSDVKEEDRGAEEDPDIIQDLALPEDDEIDARGIAGRHTDTRLQTRFTPEGLQKRLLDLYYDARTLEDEQGVNVLYLTLGALRWVDPNDKTNIRHAPLLLIPVSLERGTAGERFRLRARPEDFATNLSLENFLDRIHGIRLPEVEISEAFDLQAYFDAVDASLEGKDGWGVEPDMVVLGFFSFAKFMMYRDLDPATWPTGAPITSKPLLKGLLADGFESGEPLHPDDQPIDEVIPPAELHHILDSDSSQTLAVHEVRMGRNLVIQGPPGTGKSQTIANLIAAAVADGKTVLFVAEKMAALEVVKRRLDATGVGAACLELHSRKANKKAVLDEIKRTWENGAPRTADIGSLNTRLEELRSELNGHANRMHKRDHVSGLTPYQVIGQLVRLRSSGEQPNDLRLDRPEEWTRDGFEERHGLLRELVERVLQIGNPSQNIWYGVELVSVTPMEVERLTTRLATVAAISGEIETSSARLSTMLHAEAPRTGKELEAVIELAHRVAAAPLTREALASGNWSDISELEEILRNGELVSEVRQALRERVAGDAWRCENLDARESLRALSPTAAEPDFEIIAELASKLPPALEAAYDLAEHLGETPPDTIKEIMALSRIAEHVALAPLAPAAALADPIWEQHPGLLADLVSAVREYQDAKSQLDGKLVEAAWDTDLTETRSVLAAHGAGFLKSFSGEWRRANRLARSCLVNPGQPLETTLTQLDRLKRGKVARAAIVKDDSAGRSAFGGLWRGERSDAGQLAAVVEWQAGLGDGGKTVRRIVTREPQREEVSKLLDRLKDLTGIREAADHLSRLLGTPSEVTADLLARRAAELTAADKATSLLFEQLPSTWGERLALLDRLDEGRRSERLLAAGDPIASAAFGPLWAGADSDWRQLRASARWVADNSDLVEAGGKVEERQIAAELATEIETRTAGLGADIVKLAADLRLDLAKSFGAELDDVTMSAITARLREWSVAGEGLFQWTAYRDRAGRGRQLGCKDVVDRLEDGRLEPTRVVPSFEMAYYEALHNGLVTADADLARFDGALHSRKVAEFAEFDLQRIRVSADETVRAHYRRVPPRDGGAIGPLGVLRNELQKRRGHMPIRKLVERAGPALQALKPVFMMSPLSVAQFLAPGAVEFDLLVMDEASQIQPVDALGAVARARQVVVVGDPRQLPPTAFFARMTGGGDEDEDDGSRVTDIESILGLFTARGLPMQMLRWHYRSRHQSLIAVSNRQFYESKLFVVPSPYTAEAGMGLRFHHLPDGLFDAGGKRCNRIEAKEVARAIIEHALSDPDLSLGVAAFSVAQRRAILDELELLRRAHPETEGFFHSHPSEPFFVKNLENVQGDERDVIFISVGYGPTVPGGRVPMRFGPLGSEGGERRLNVLISRAKQRCEVFSSMTDEDIDPDFAQSRKGVFAFRMFLHFARTGNLAMGEATARDHDSVFEEQVAKALQERGYHVHRQVGLAGFFIDLAVSDPERPGRYLLGIECDGAAYHDALSARDRDRLRQSVLESHGWHIHRIWSTDWFQRPQQELARAIAAIDAAKAEDAAREVKRQKPTVRITSQDAGDYTLMGVEMGEAAAAGVSVPNLYEEAPLQRTPHHFEALHELPRDLMISYVERVAEIEGPVHFDEVVTRIREAWGLKRAGARIRDAVGAAADVAARKGSIVRDGDFVSVEGRRVVMRDRSMVASPGLRKPETISLNEIAAGAVAIAIANYGAPEDQLVT